jgi:cell wall-associated NlpC family hydrolase
MKIIAFVLPALIAALPVRAADALPESTASAPVQAAAPAEKNNYLERASEVVLHALGLLGVNYKFGGSSPDSGLDCSGLVSLVFKDVAGLVLPRNSRAMSKFGDIIDKTGLQPGDLVFFNTGRQPFSHVGIYIGEERFVHAPRRGREVEVASMHDRYWQKRYNGARRVNF